MAGPSDCVFCRIVAGELPAAMVLEDDLVVGFLDSRPLFPGHVLVIPRAHHETLSDLPAELLEPLFGAVQRIATALPAALDADGTFVAENNVVSQSVPHLHVHVVPRRRKDYASVEEMEVIAAQIRATL
jgi:histidine triad (HIT) family protein